jgi:hypothetical protein
MGRPAALYAGMEPDSSLQPLATLGHLRAYRRRLDHLRAAEAAVRYAGYTSSPELLAELGDLSRMLVALGAPCVLCGDCLPVPTRVDDPGEAEPTGVLCATCDAATTAEVEGA